MVVVVVGRENNDQPLPPGTRGRKTCSSLLLHSLHGYVINQRCRKDTLINGSCFF